MVRSAWSANRRSALAMAAADGLAEMAALEAETAVPARGRQLLREDEDRARHGQPRDQHE